MNGSLLKNLLSWMKPVSEFHFSVLVPLINTCIPFSKFSLFFLKCSHYDRSRYEYLQATALHLWNKLGIFWTLGSVLFSLLSQTVQVYYFCKFFHVLWFLWEIFKNLMFVELSHPRHFHIFFISPSLETMRNTD